MNSLPPIRPPSSCGVYSTPGYTGIPEATDHHHDGLYYSKDTADCAMRAAAARIVGTPPPSTCVDCSALAGYAISTYWDTDAVVTLQIVNYTDPGAGPYAAPSVMSVVTTGTDVVVTWGPDNNDASISLALIAAAIAADEEASAVLRIAVCDLDQFVLFNAGVPVTLVIYPAHSHTSGDITDSSDGGNGVADANKLLRFMPNGSITTTVGFTIISPTAGLRYLSYQVNDGSISLVHGTPAGEDYLLLPAVPSGKVWTPGPSGTFAVMEGVTDGSDASPGIVGQYLEASATDMAILLSDGVVFTAGSLTLPPGDWDVDGYVMMTSVDPSAMPRFTAELGATAATIDFIAPSIVATPVAYVGLPFTVPVFRKRISIATSTTIYLSAQATEVGAGSSLDAYMITARRVR